MRTWRGRRRRGGHPAGLSWRLCQGHRSVYCCCWRRCARRCGRRRTPSLCRRRRSATGRSGLPSQDRLLDLCLARGRHRLQMLGPGEGRGCGFVVGWVQHKPGLVVDSMKGWVAVDMVIAAEKRHLNTSSVVLGIQREAPGGRILQDFECEMVGCWRPRIEVGSLRKRQKRLRAVQLPVRCPCHCNYSSRGRQTGNWECCWRPA